MKTPNATLLGVLIFLSLTGTYSCKKKNPLAEERKSTLFAENSNHFTTALTKGNLNQFISFYHDSVLYRDQVYGSSDWFTTTNLRTMFEPLFNPTNGWNIKLVTKATDIENETLMLKLNVQDSTNTVWEYAGWFKFNNGKIVEQLDFSMYPVQDLLTSPRFTKYFEEAKLKIISKE